MLNQLIVNLELLLLPFTIHSWLDIHYPHLANMMVQRTNTFVSEQYPYLFFICNLADVTNKTYHTGHHSVNHLLSAVHVLDCIPFSPGRLFVPR